MDEVETLYVHVHPEREEFADGYAAGLNRDDEVEYIVIVNPLVPRDKLYISHLAELFAPALG